MPSIWHKNCHFSYLSAFVNTINILFEPCALVRAQICCHGALPVDVSHRSNGGTGSGGGEITKSGICWMDEQVNHLTSLGTLCAPESGKRKMGLKRWIKDEWGSLGFDLRLIWRRIAVLSSVAEQWRPACEVSARRFSASSRGNESHYRQCGVSFMAQTGLDSASDIVSIHW